MKVTLNLYEPKKIEEIENEYLSEDLLDIIDDKYFINEEAFYEDKLSISIDTEFDMSLSDILCDRDRLNKIISQALHYKDLDPDYEFMDMDTKYYLELQRLLPDLENNIDTIVLSSNADSVISFLNNNKDLKDISIVVRNDGYKTADLKKLKPYLDEFSISFKAYNDPNQYTYEEMYNATKILENWEDEIRQGDFSPLEIAIYAYDLIRDKEYKLENENMDWTQSRKIVPILNSDYIVCAGYVELYRELLSRFDIPVMDYTLLRKDDDRKGHSIAQVYIKDPKYNIDGVFYCDPTANRKKKDNTFLYVYHDFLKPRDKFLESKDKYIDVTIPLTINNLKIRMENVVKGNENFTLNTMNYINKLYRFPAGKSFYSSSVVMARITKNDEIFKKDNKEKTSKLFSYYEQEIFAETFLSALYEVKKQQHELNQEKCRFDINAFLFACKNANFEFKNPDPCVALMKAITGKTSEKDVISNFSFFLNSTTNMEEIVKQLPNKAKQKKLNENKE